MRRIKFTVGLALVATVRAVGTSQGTFPGDDGPIVFRAEHAHLLTDLGVVIDAKAHVLGVKSSRAINVRDGDLNHFKA